jgi:alpha-glucosidase (family GH31 glycosyl hydrolase)
MYFALFNRHDEYLLTLNMKYVKLRYQLIPYVQKLFQNLQGTGSPILRALYHDFSSDEFVTAATAINNPLVTEEYMFGELSFIVGISSFNVQSCTGKRLLVAPVTVAGASTKDVYLPKLPRSLTDQGFHWTHWYDYIF